MSTAARNRTQRVRAAARFGAFVAALLGIVAAVLLIGAGPAQAQSAGTMVAGPFSATLP